MASMSAALDERALDLVQDIGWFARASRGRGEQRLLRDVSETLHAPEEEVPARTEKETTARENGVRVWC